MAKKVGDYQIPFDKDGNQLHYPETWSYRGCVWKDNDPFEDTIEPVTLERGRSAAYFVFKRKSDGTEVTMFMKDLMEAFNKINNGKITGTFRFVKRGMNYGIALMDS